MPLWYKKIYPLGHGCNIRLLLYPWPSGVLELNQVIIAVLDVSRTMALNSDKT